MNNSTPKLVSVGIPTYNRPEGLRRTLECFTNQTYQNLEIIISDNFSVNPEVREVILDFAKKDKRIRYYFQDENLGPERNFQFVLEKSTGAYFMWAADDDYWEKEFVATMVSLLESNNEAVMAFCSFRSSNGTEVFNYLEKHPGLSSSNIDTRLNTYLSIPDETAGKPHIIYSLHRKENILNCFRDNLFYWSLKNCAPDNFLDLNLLITGPVIFSEKTLVIFEADNFKFYGSEAKKKTQGILVFFIIFKKYCNVWAMISRYYYYVMKTILRSRASNQLKLYWFFRYPVYILWFIAKTTKRLLFDKSFWKKYFN